VPEEEAWGDDLFASHFTVPSTVLASQRQWRNAWHARHGGDGHEPSVAFEDTAVATAGAGGAAAAAVDEVALSLLFMWSHTTSVEVTEDAGLRAYSALPSEEQAEATGDVYVVDTEANTSRGDAPPGLVRIGALVAAEDGAWERPLAERVRMDHAWFFGHRRWFDRDDLQMVTVEVHVRTALVRASPSLLVIRARTRPRVAARGALRLGAAVVVQRSGDSCPETGVVRGHRETGHVLVETWGPGDDPPALPRAGAMDAETTEATGVREVDPRIATLSLWFEAPAQLGAVTSEGAGGADARAAAAAWAVLNKSADMSARLVDHLTGRALATGDGVVEAQAALAETSELTPHALQTAWPASASPGDEEEPLAPPAMARALADAYDAGGVRRLSSLEGWASPAVLVRAPAGGGKSWVALQLVHALCGIARDRAGGEAGSPPLLVPLLVNAAKLAARLRLLRSRGDVSLRRARSAWAVVEDYALHVLACSEAETQAVLSALQELRLVVVLDGMDVAADLGDPFWRFASALVQMRVRIVVTARPETVANGRWALDFALVDLAPVSEDQRLRAVERALEVAGSPYYEALVALAAARSSHDEAFAELKASASVDDCRTLEEDSGFAWTERAEVVHSAFAGKHAKLRAPKRNPREAEALKNLLFRYRRGGHAPVSEEELWRHICHCTNDMSAAATALAPELNAALERLEADLEGAVRVARAWTKGRVLTFEEALDDAGGGVEEARAVLAAGDVLRGRVVCSSLGAMRQVLEWLVDRGASRLPVVRVANECVPAHLHPSRARRVLVNAKVTNQAITMVAQIEVVHETVLSLDQKLDCRGALATLRRLFPLPPAGAPGQLSASGAFGSVGAAGALGGTTAAAALWGGFRGRHWHLQLEGHLGQLGHFSSSPVQLRLLSTLLDLRGGERGMGLPETEEQLYRHAIRRVVHRHVADLRQHLAPTKVALEEEVSAALRVLSALAFHAHTLGLEEVTGKHMARVLKASPPDMRRAWARLLGPALGGGGEGEVPLVRVLALDELEPERQRLAFEHPTLQEALFGWALPPEPLLRAFLKGAWDVSARDVHFLTNPRYARAKRICGRSLDTLWASVADQRSHWQLESMQLGQEDVRVIAHVLGRACMREAGAGAGASAGAAPPGAGVGVGGGEAGVLSLSLESNPIGAAGAEFLASYLQGRMPPPAAGAAHTERASFQPTLQRLNVKNASIGDAGVERLAAALRSNARLTDLNLFANGITALGATHLAEALKDNDAITIVNLRGNQVGAEGARAVAAALRVNRAVADLDLSWNAIGDEGAQHIAGMLAVNAALTGLNLWTNELTDVTRDGIRTVWADTIDKSSRRKIGGLQL